METGDQGLHVRLRSGVVERLRRYAENEGLAPGAALEAVFLLGLDLAERSQVRLRDELETVRRDVRDLREMVDLVGPAALGVLRVLVHWAAQTGGLRVSEEELLAEAGVVAKEEWEGQLAARGLLSSLRDEGTE